jgi:hypothetical protein
MIGHFGFGQRFRSCPRITLCQSRDRYGDCSFLRDRLIFAFEAIDGQDVS